ncbi:MULTISPECIES: hypothetical protein [unclassified Avibacterium]|uniref:hypothetical protein n=1 Tax=unclassified Avibacterium TaxID=2685287 RepID=UPI0022457AB2|nr:MULTISPECIES: hypothetical protein [unclassified Avibacterium]MCW9698781.1 hypothetical protein [Avibacterium sp. 20-129]MCW9717874.1 hypothetical protein [Avibacterium sp. 21-599]
MTNKKNTIIIYIFILFTILGVMGVFCNLLSTAICCFMSFVAIVLHHRKKYRYSRLICLLSIVGVVLWVPIIFYISKNTLDTSQFCPACLVGDDIPNNTPDTLLSGIIIPLLYILFSNRISNALKAVLREERKKLKNNNATRK